MRNLILFIFAAICVCLVASVPLKGLSNPQAGVGCNDTQDLAVFVKDNSTFHATLQKCATECLGNEGCSSSCIQKTLGLTADCADCFAVDVVCTFKNCARFCAPDPNGSDCVNCSLQYCDPALIVCAQVDGSVIPK
eukprot:Phypoly_transcript_21576.p1 GENE.Phypoly_transcript_21576~~Phypoly_transcript_21576.p1  ORF type:complete len:136 (+),score=6.22 Phypoly_transcript_21576:152-559(+)